MDWNVRTRKQKKDLETHGTRPEQQWPSKGENLLDVRLEDRGELVGPDAVTKRHRRDRSTCPLCGCGLLYHCVLRYPFCR